MKSFFATLLIIFMLGNIANAQVNTPPEVAPKTPISTQDTPFETARRLSIETRQMPEESRNWQNVLDAYLNAYNLGDNPQGSVMGIASSYRRLHDEENYVKWLRIGAEAQMPELQYHLAAHISLSHPDHCEEARVWLEKAIANGHIHSMAALGQYYERGTCGVKDQQKSNVYHSMAANLGYVVSQNIIAYNYLTGNGFPINRIKAWAWFKISSLGILPSSRRVDFDPNFNLSFLSRIERNLTDFEKEEARSYAHMLCETTQACINITFANRP